MKKLVTGYLSMVDSHPDNIKVFEVNKLPLGAKHVLGDWYYKITSHQEHFADGSAPVPDDVIIWIRRNGLILTDKI